MLGEIYFVGSAFFPKNYAQAVIYLTPLASLENQREYPHASAAASFMLGQIYYDGGYGVTKDYEKANNYLGNAVKISLIHSAQLKYILCAEKFFTVAVTI